METDFLKSLFEAIQDSAILVDKAGRIVDWNSGSTSLFGYPRKEMIGRSINIIYQHSIPFPKLIHDILPHHKKWENETVFVRKNGSKGHCKVILHAIKHEDTHKVAAIVIHQNLTAHKEAQQELDNVNKELQSEILHSNEFFYRIFALLVNTTLSLEQTENSLRETELSFHLLAENATDTISRHEPNGNYLYISPSSKALLGYTHQELLGRNLFRFIHHEDINKLKKAFNRRKENNGPQIVVYRFRKKDGEYRWFESNIRTIYDEDSRTIREIQSASRDITEQVLDKKARLRGQQLAHVFRLSTMEEMASGMAHEIGQPLAAIVNYTQGCVRYLQKENHDPTQLTEIMKKAVVQAERAGEVIHRLKNFFCKGKVYKTPCKINSVIRETVSLIRHDLNNHKTKVEFDLEKNIPMVSADKIQIQQVMVNLVTNSIEAIREANPKDRKITIHTKNIDKDIIEVGVGDTGPGFSKEIITKVFRPFFTTKAHGTGMGLAICRSIVEAHGGQFIINPNTHHVSLIRFTLPIT